MIVLTKHFKSRLRTRVPKYRGMSNQNLEKSFQKEYRFVSKYGKLVVLKNNKEEHILYQGYIYVVVREKGKVVLKTLLLTSLRKKQLEFAS